MKYIWVFLLTLASFGCGYGSMYQPTMAVRMTDLSPNTVTAGGPGFLLTVNGSGFSMNSVVYWGSTPLMTRFIGGNQLVAEVPAFQVMSRGTIQVYVLSSNNMISNTMNFTVK